MSGGAHDETIASSLPLGGGDGFATGTERVAGRYQIVRWLGGGGMGRVYEALDSELDERIALKVLRVGLPEEALERFRREVKLTRRIQHRNVARMFDIGDHAGDKFLTMELIDGQSLTHALGTPMAWNQLRDVSLQICAGLVAAHATGVVHRDLKPDNVLVETATGRVVITDFGIARGADDGSVTQLGSVLGTPRYMAPEQLAGEELDARADLFSLGVMLYELATGTRPWSGDGAVAIAVAQATKPARRLDAKVPAGFAAIVEQCLAIDRASRPASASEIEAAIKAAGDVALQARPGRSTLSPLASPTPTPAMPSPLGGTALAVLPFASAPDDAYLADGVREDLIDTLSTTVALRVRPAGVVAHGCDPREVGRELEVDHVVVGSVRRIGGELRVSARLVGVADGFQIWAQRTECTEAQILSVSEQLGRGIATALSTRAASAERPTDPRAVELYLRARVELRRFWGQHAATAADLLEEAVAIAPGSLPILIAYAHASAQAWAKTSRPELLERARRAVELALATGHGEAFLASALLRLNLGDPEGAAAELALALSRAPMSATAHELAGRLLIEVGDVIAGKHHFQTAIGLDPGRAVMISIDLLRVDALAGDASEVQRRIAGLYADPDPAINRIGAMCQARVAGWHRDDATLEAALVRLQKTPDQTTAMVKLVRAHAAGRPFEPEVWRRVYASVIRDDPARRAQLVTMQRMTESALLMEQVELAIECLSKADELGLIDVVWLDLCPLFDELRAEPRWRAARDRIAARAARVLGALRGVSDSPGLAG